MYLQITLIVAILSQINIAAAWAREEPSIQHPRLVLPRFPIHRRTTDQDYVNYVIAASNQMMTWYDASTGLFDGAWWNSANVVTTLANFYEKFPDEIGHITDQVFPTTLVQAPKALGYTGFLNGFYDDELWWALAWIKVFDVTGEERYLTQAALIFEDAKISYGSSSCGALWWDKSHSGTNSVENELYLTTAAKLANRLPSTPSSGYYYSEAIKSYNWFVGSGLINSDNLINDHLSASPDCANDFSTSIFTYNQGILLSGLTELAWSAPDPAMYNDLANTLAMAGLAHFTDANGLLHELVCEPNCSADLQQFKGIFSRNILFMINRMNGITDAQRATYIKFLQVNANSIWANDQVDNQLGVVWSGPKGAVTIQTQSSALDVIVGAACVS
ncbi:glycoside hydrolase [Calycina marina]|uniref:Glycoside hydrolase n=1 Tax=Calycina marina TaxID=1763456 RepID=A0A9P7YWW6_9HELO|nr:glycoside hydrolase [Calycina marina]